MAEHDYLPHVRQHYEELPYPPRKPEDERKRLLGPALDRLPIINQYCFKGRQTFGQGFRVLVAGGGTGDSTIFLAEQLRGTGAEVVYLDLSTASKKICEERARVRGLTNIAFHHGSIMNIAGMGLGAFDFVSCTGVLMHLADPDAGLKSLVGVLKPNGAMNLMVYARYGRAAYYMVQNLLKLVNRGVADTPTKVRRLKTVLKSLPNVHWLKFKLNVRLTEDAKGDFGDSGLYDLYLHEQDRAWTLPELWQWLVADNGLHIPVTPGCNGEQIFYRPETFVGDQEVLEALKRLPLHEQWAAGELLYGQISKHNLYLCREPATALDIEDPDALLTPLDEQMRVLREKALKGREGEFGINTSHIKLKLRLTPVLRATLRALDGTRTAREVINAAATDLGNVKPDDLWGHSLPQFRTLMDVGYLYLRHRNVPRFPDMSELQGRIGG
jgi:2-polyprenyl-3-methyl-5-hydroxy-6-metoxy-1,4-benzoquinol methylase